MKSWRKPETSVAGGGECAAGCGGAPVDERLAEAGEVGGGGEVVVRRGREAAAVGRRRVAQDLLRAGVDDVQEVETGIGVARIRGHVAHVIAERRVAAEAQPSQRATAP